MLQIRLLGQFDIRVDGKRVTISSRAGQSLFAYLVLTAGTLHRREKLAGMFWPDASDENARRNLRQELWRIRKAISVQQPDTVNYLLADEFTLTFNRDAEYWLDVAQLERPDLDTQSLMSNLALYQGEPLPGFYEDWIALERGRIQSIFNSKMDQMLGQLITAEQWALVQEQAERWLSLGNTPEPAYRALLLAYGARGDMAKVSSIYQRCIEELEEQFGLEPSAETRALYDGLIKGAQVSPRTVRSSGTITFLFTDIEGSTNLLDKLGEQYAELLVEHHRILRAAIKKWNGQEMETQGDAFFVTFARAMDAVQCAAEAQRALALHPWPYDQPLRVRMGLHTGEPIFASTGYVGMDVHRAARIGDAAHGGQVLLSQTTRDLILHDLPHGMTIRDLGEHRLKDLKYPTPIFQLVMEGLRHDFPSLRTKFSGSEAPAPGEPPFKGLQYFDQADSNLFFGRELLTAKLVHRLSQTQFLSVIIGASGSGKSSLVRAGLIPALKKGDPLLDGRKPPEGSRNWRIHIVTPTVHPLEALAIELTHDSESITAATTLMDDLMQDPRSLGLFLARKNSGYHTLLVLDQFEELFTLCHDEFEREAFIDNLLNLVSPGQSNATLILTLRADFYAHLAQYPELRDAVAQQQEYIGPMTAEELRLAIEEPAKRGHWTFEPGLVDLILRDVGDEPGSLPLLSHALLETWKRRSGHTLTLKGYADAGGVRGAIAHTAETVYQNLSPDEQSVARYIFLRLTELGEGTEDTRRRASFDELMSSAENADKRSEVRAVLNSLADARLITLGDDTAEVAHEALIREWPTLREWLNQDRESLRLHRRLTEAAYEWELLGRDPGALYRGAHLAQARAWAELHPNTLNTGERAFLNTSIEQEQHEEREREEQQKRELEAAQKLAETERARAEEQAHSANRLQIRNRVITTIGSIALILALLAGMFGVQSNRNEVQAETNLGIAESNFRQAEAQRLAAEASKLILSQGSPEQIALLSVRSMNVQYTYQGDAALSAAATLKYPKQIFAGSSEYRIREVVFSPDGKYFLIANGDGPWATLRDARSGKKIRTFSYSGVEGVAFSLDSKYILTGSWDKMAILWNAETGTQESHFTGHNGSVLSVAISPDNRQVLTGSLDGTARLWDVVTGKQLHEFTIATNGDWVCAVAFSPDGKYLLLGKSKGAVELRDAQTGIEIRQFKGSTSTISSVAFSPDGKVFLAGGDLVARLWDVSTGNVLQNFIGHTWSIQSVAFSPDGKYVFTGSADGTARKWDPQSGEELERFVGSMSENGEIAISPDGKALLTVSSGGETRLWNLSDPPKLPIFRSTGVVNSAKFSLDGKYVFTGDTNGMVWMWDAVTGEKLRDFTGHTSGINYGLAVSPNGKYILTGSWDSTIRLWDIETGAELRQFIGPTTAVESVAFSPDGQYVSAGAGDGTWIWFTETGQQRLQLRDFNFVNRVVFSPDGKYIATAGGTGTAAYSAQAQLWDASNGQLIKSFPIAYADFTCVAFSPDGKYLLTATSSNLVQLWDIQTRRLVHNFDGHTAIIWTATFSPDGKYIATASADGTARIWDAQTGQELRRLIGHSNVVENVDFSPDGRYLLTGGEDGTVRLLDVDYRTTMAYLCAHVRDFTDAERAQYNIRHDAPTCPAK